MFPHKNKRFGNKYIHQDNIQIRCMVRNDYTRLFGYLRSSLSIQENKSYNLKKEGKHPHQFKSSLVIFGVLKKNPKNRVREQEHYQKNYGKVKLIQQPKRYQQLIHHTNLVKEKEIAWKAMFYFRLIQNYSQRR